MIKPEQIPDEVFEAFQKAWADTSTLSTKECLAAAINAWPGAVTNYSWDASHGRLILPLPQKETKQ